MIRTVVYCPLYSVNSASRCPVSASICCRNFHERWLVDPERQSRNFVTPNGGLNGESYYQYTTSFVLGLRVGTPSA